MAFANPVKTLRGTNEMGRAAKIGAEIQGFACPVRPGGIRGTNIEVLALYTQKGVRGAKGQISFTYRL
jgi:hypothetical protein